MGWAKVSIVAVGIVSASVAVLALTSQADQAGGKDQAGTTSRRERVIVRPQIEIFRGNGSQLGVSLRELDDASAREHKLASPEGALVESVQAGSAAEKAGVKDGDVITAFDAERVRSVKQLQRLVAETPPGRQVKVTVMRDGRKTELTVTPDRATGPMALRGGDNAEFEVLERNLGRLGRDLPRMYRFEVPDDQAPGDVVPAPRTPRTPETPNAPAAPGTPRWRMPFPELPLYQWSGGAGRLGAVVQELTPQLREYFGAKEGVLVASVSPDTPAARAGLKAGDVIMSVDGKPVEDANALIGMIRSHPEGQDVSIGILRDRKPQTLKVKLLGSQRARPI